MYHIDVVKRTFDSKKCSGVKVESSRKEKENYSNTQIVNYKYLKILLMCTWMNVLSYIPPQSLLYISLHSWKNKCLFLHNCGLFRKKHRRAMDHLLSVSWTRWLLEKQRDTLIAFVGSFWFFISLINHLSLRSMYFMTRGRARPRVFIFEQRLTVLNKTTLD